MNKIINFFKDEEGATAIEYGLLIALIAVVIIITVTFLGRNVEIGFNKVGVAINAANKT